MRRESKEGSLKQGAIVMAALAFAWLTIEMAFKPWLNHARSALSNSDSDDDFDFTASASASASTSDDKTQ
ncbi:hypothetical protein vseg_005413 [Gypsophila vaccaria]